MSISALRNALARYRMNLKGYIDDRLPAILVSEEITLSADSDQTYDVAALLGSSVGNYDLISTQIVVKVRDTVVSSPTYNYFINSEAVVSHGINAAGTVVIHNYSDSAVTLWVHIETPKTTGG